MKKFMLALSILFFAHHVVKAIPFSADSATKKVPFFENSKDYNKKRVHSLERVVLTGEAINIVAMRTLWYSNYSLVRFHFFNDLPEWEQMDKCGHTTSTFTMVHTGIETCLWAGMPMRKALWVGAIPGYTFMLTMETFDGLARNWGFSPTDLCANTLGASLAIGQMALWGENRMTLKFSYHESPYHTINPDLLGHNPYENLVKDYNGMSYWVSNNIHSYMKHSTAIPKWLNIAVGYGAQGMIGGRYNYNVKTVKGTVLDYSNIKRERRFFLSLDADLTKVKLKPGLLNTLVHTFGFIKIPAPTLEYRKNGFIKFHPLYY